MGLNRGCLAGRRISWAYLLKEELRLVLKLKGPRAVALLDAWLVWARRCRIPTFVKLAPSITDHHAGIQATLLHGLSNALIESVNTKLRLLTRIAFGFPSPDALIGLAMLALGGLCPHYPADDLRMQSRKGRPVRTLGDVRPSPQHATNGASPASYDRAGVHS